MSVPSLPKLVYKDYFWYNVVENGKIVELDHPDYNILKNGKEFTFGDDIGEGERNGRMFHVDKPFYEDEDNSLKIRIADSKFISFGPSPKITSPEYPKLPLLFISLQDIDPDDFEELRKFFLYDDDLCYMDNFLKVYHSVLGECYDANDNLTTGFWVVCEKCYPQTLGDYVKKNKIISDEIKFMTYDFLKIAQDVSKLKYPCVIDERTIMLSRDPASPFPKLMLSPLAFILGKLNKVDGEENEDPFPQIANMIEKLGELEENEEIIKELKNNQPIQNIMKLPNTTNLKYFVNGPVCSINDFKFADENPLGRDTFGTLWKATDSATDSNGDIVAIKACKNGTDPSSEINYLKREAIAMRLCDHKNIVEFISLTTKDSLPSSIENSCDTSQLQNVGIVMEYCEGGDLESYVENYRKENKDNNLPLDLIGNIFHQMAEAQRYFHFEKRMIHRDIKLKNFLIKYEPQLTIKCYGFGCSRSISETFTEKAGTPFFAAPNIILGEPYSDKSDLYSLGICLYYLTTSNFPFESMNSLKEAIKNKTPIKFPSKFQTEEYESIIDLVTKLTKYEEDERISWEEFYEHPYMK
ncbi:Protein kinase domain containing protein [Entamoeba marina]